MTSVFVVFFRAFPSLGLPFLIAKDTQPTFLLFSKLRIPRYANIYMSLFLFYSLLWSIMLSTIAYHHLELVLLVVFWSVVYFFLRPISVTQKVLFTIAVLQLGFLTADLLIPNYLQIKQFFVYTSKDFTDSGRGVAGIFAEPTDNSFLQLVLSLKLLRIDNAVPSNKSRFLLFLYNLFCFVYTLSLFSFAVLVLTTIYLFLRSAIMALFLSITIMSAAVYGFSFTSSERVMNILDLLISGQFLDLLYGTSAFYRFAPIWEFKQYLMPVALYEYADLISSLNFTNSSGVTRQMSAASLDDIYTMLKRMPLSLGFYIYGSLFTLFCLAIISWLFGMKWLPFLILLGCMTVSPFSPIFLILFAREQR